MTILKAGNANGQTKNKPNTEGIQSGDLLFSFPLISLSFPFLLLLIIIIIIIVTVNCSKKAVMEASLRSLRSSPPSPPLMGFMNKERLTIARKTNAFERPANQYEATEKED